MLVSFVHSIKMCFIMYWFPHGHLGGGSSFRMKEWVNPVCPMHSRARVVSSLLVLLGSSFFSFKMGCTWKSLSWGLFSHNCCHFFVMIWGSIFWLLHIWNSHSQFLSGLRFYIIAASCAGLHPSLCGLLHKGVLMFC